MHHVINSKEFEYKVHVVHVVDDMQRVHDIEQMQAIHVIE